MRYRRSPRAHNGDGLPHTLPACCGTSHIQVGRKTVARCAATHESRVRRHIQQASWTAFIGDDHVD